MKVTLDLDGRKWRALTTVARRYGTTAEQLARDAIAVALEAERERARAAARDGRPRPPARPPDGSKPVDRPIAPPRGPALIDDGRELKTVWNGTIGRQGVSLTR